MQRLNLPKYNFNIKEIDGKYLIFDDLRKKFVALTPEEWVRQNFVQYLISEKKAPKGLIINEFNINLNNTHKRCDIVIFNTKAQPQLIVECKAPSVKINQRIFDQIARYNIVLKVAYLVVTNGLEHFCCKIDFDLKTYKFIPEIPDFEDIKE